MVNIFQIKNVSIDSSSDATYQQFKVVENNASGNCLFYAVFKFLKILKNTFDAVPNDANELRIQTVNYVLSTNSKGFKLNFDRFQDSLIYNLQEQIPIISKYGENETVDSEIRNAYLEYMSTPGKCGTLTELCAMAEIFGFIGYMFQQGDSGSYTSYEFGFTGNGTLDTTKPTLFLLFNGDISDGHFRLLTPINQSHPSLNLSGRYELIKSETSSNTKTIQRLRVGRDVTSPDNNTNSQDPKPQQATKENAFICDVCKQSFKTQRGMNVHRNRHAKEANKATAERIRFGTNPAKTVTPLKGKKSTGRAVCDESKALLDAECKKWQDVFNSYENSDTLVESEFDKDVKSFLEFMFKSNEKLPGPKHPAIKFYRLRQNKKKTINSAQYSRPSNPQCTDMKAKQRRRDKYQYDLTQYWFYNQRRKAVLEVMKLCKSKKCNIKLSVLEEHFKNLFGKTNDCVRESYPISIVSRENVYLKPEQIQLQIKRISLDTIAGPDRVLTRTLRQLNVSSTICSMANTMLRTSYVPNSFRHGRMVLLDKEDNPKEVDNWRPLTIYSIVRRVIEKALDSILRTQVEINCNQRGFVIGMPGCHVNARLTNACLKKAKKSKGDLTIVFLDVSKAFDRIGHRHISEALQSHGVSSNLHNLIMNLLTDNHVTITTGNETSNNIEIKCGVPHGGPLSPFLFNIAINFLYEELCDPQFVDTYGYKLSDGYDALGLAGFADDQAIAGKNEKCAIRAIEVVQVLLAVIGLQVNPNKSQAIIIKKGKLCDNVLRLSNGDEIIGVKADERIKYLGCSFNSELISDDSCIERFNNDLTKLSSTPLLKPDQKLNIINQYVFPTLTYPLQSAPLDKVPQYVIAGLDIMIRRTAKDVIGLPMHTIDNLFYAPWRLRGLGLIKTEWEIHLQHFAIAKCLSTVHDQLFQSISNCPEEMESCVRALNVDGNSTKTLRMALRQRCYDEWCKRKYQGAGVTHFQTHIKSNDFVCNKNALSSSEWTAAIKLNSNYANLNGVPGVVSSSNLCRKCNRENETIPHVTGSCPSNNQQITTRHHNVKHQITKLLRDKGLHCFEEVYAFDTDGRKRFSDIVTFDPKSTKAYIIDPTVRYESSDIEQDKKICDEKQQIYEKCIPYYNEKYAATFGERDWNVRGLWFGSRGTVGDSVSKCFSEFKLGILSAPQSYNQN